MSNTSNVPTLIDCSEDVKIPIGDLFVYSRKIIEKKLSGGKINRNLDKSNIQIVVVSLKEIAEKRTIDDFELKDNSLEWIKDILDGYNEKKSDTLRFLVNDFTNSMMTRMREGDKYVVAIVGKGFLLLCHSRGGQSTITPAWQVVKRMMDTDNVDRFVLFSKNNNSISVEYFEHSHTESFSYWLGIPEKECYSYLGGANRLYSQIDGCPVVLELNDNDVDRIFSDEYGHLDVNKSQLVLRNPINVLTIDQVRVGKKKFGSMPDFLQNYLLKRYDLTFYKDEYSKIAKSLNSLSFQYIDDFDAVFKLEKGEEQVQLKKKNPNVKVIFCGPLRYGDPIQIRPSYLASIYADFINNKPVKIFHAGMEIFPSTNSPLNIGSMTILNNLNESPIVNQLLFWHEQTSKKDCFLEKAINYTIFDLMVRDNEKEPISYLFDKMKQEIARNISIHKVMVENEGTVIEFKSRDYLVGKNDEISSRIVSDLKKKLKENPFKIYLFGVDEKTKKIETSSDSRLPSDRIGKLEESIVTEYGVPLEVTITCMPLNGESMILMCARLIDHYSG